MVQVYNLLGYSMRSKTDPDYAAALEYYNMVWKLVLLLKQTISALLFNVVLIGLTTIEQELCFLSDNIAAHIFFGVQHKY